MTTKHKLTDLPVPSTMSTQDVVAELTSLQEGISLMHANISLNEMSDDFYYTNGKRAQDMSSLGCLLARERVLLGELQHRSHNHVLGL